MTQLNKLRATFVMEQHLGHGTFYQNLHRSLHRETQLDATWIAVTYANTGGWWERIALLPTHLRGTLNGRKQVRRALREQSSDVTFFNTQVPAALAGSLARTQPYVLCTDITPLQYNALRNHYHQQPASNGLVERYKHGVNVRLMQQAAHLIPWSTWVRNSMIADYGVAPEHITVVPPGVDTKRWQAHVRPAQGKPVRILFVGGDFQRKGGDTLRQAFRRLPAGSAELILVTRTAIEPESGITVHTALQANSPELIALYQSADLFVLPTRAEAFGIAAVEASATGLPVLASQVGGVTDIVVEGETGLLIQPDAVEQLTAALHLLVNNPALRQQMGQAARRHVEQHFDADKNATKIVQILGEVVNQ
jgi:glycosyltransferase involved in cell wall biosynthesis